MSVPESIIREATIVAASLLPEKSSSRYEREYSDFKNWQKKNGVVGVTEDVLLTYVNHLSARFSPNSLWAKWSMLKSCLQIKENVQIQRFQKVIAFLKRKNERYTPKKAKVLTKEEVERFLINAPDDHWLLAKIITIFGIFGCCRCDELLSLTMNDVEDMGKYIIVTLRQTKNLTSRRFTVTDDDCSFKPCTLVKKYISLRPARTENLRFFLTYRNGKCVCLNAGQHTVGAVPKQIAKYLGLKEPDLYTGHSFRRSGATMVVDAGGDILALKRAGGWKSSEIAMSYVDDSINNKIKMSKKLFPASESTNDMPSTSAISTTADASLSTISSSTSAISTTADASLSTISSSKFGITGNTNCTMIFNIYDTNKTEFSNVNNATNL